MDGIKGVGVYRGMNGVNKGDATVEDNRGMKQGVVPAIDVLVTVGSQVER